jgi:hypothetical protein
MFKRPSMWSCSLLVFKWSLCVLYSNLVPIMWLFPSSVQIIPVSNDVPHWVKMIPMCGHVLPCFQWSRCGSYSHAPRGQIFLVYGHDHPPYSSGPSCMIMSPSFGDVPPFDQKDPSVWSRSPLLCVWYVHPCVKMIPVCGHAVKRIQFVVCFALCFNNHNVGSCPPVFTSVWSSICCVSRWRKLPRGTDRNWAHVVDARLIIRIPFNMTKTILDKVYKYKTDINLFTELVREPSLPRSGGGIQRCG